MSLISDLLRRKETFEPSDVELAGDIDSAFAQELEEATLEAEAAEQPEIEDDPVHLPANNIEPSRDVLSAHAQGRMASFKIFDEANRNAREAPRMGKAFTTIVTSYNMGRDFLDDCEDEIMRSSELELANSRFAQENRRLQERLERHDRLRERLEDVIQSMKRREARLIQDSDTLRENLSDLRMEMVELRNANATAEAARGDMHLTLAGRNAEVERLQRELDSAREAQIGLTSELESTQRKHTEARRKLEEVQSHVQGDGTRTVELTNRLALAEKEVARLQRQNDASEAQLVELSDARRTSEQDIHEAERRHQAELQALRAEVEQWKESLKIATATGLTNFPMPRLASSDDMLERQAAAAAGRRNGVKFARAEANPAA